MQEIKDVIEALQQVNYECLSFLMKFLHLVSSNCNVNKMTSANLALVIAPNIMKSANSDLNPSLASLLDTPVAARITQILIENYAFIFMVRKRCALTYDILFFL